MNKFFLDLGKQPLANNFLKKFEKNQIKYQLKLYFNTKTKLVSISKRIPSQKMFNNTYPYRSSMSKTMRLAFANLAKKINKRFKPNLLLEIGSNDGALLKKFHKNNVIGVEPCKNLAEITKKSGYVTFDEYWDLRLAKKICKRFKKVNLIYSANTLTHISNLNNVFRSIKYVLSENGVLIIEDPSLLECIKIGSYDQFYNEHIYVFSALAVKNLINKFNLEIFDIENLQTHGGSLRYYIKYKSNKKIKIKKSVKNQLSREIKFGLNKFKTYQSFASKSFNSKKNLLKLLKSIKLKGERIIGYGATAKATTVLNYCQIDNKMIDYFVDTTPDKSNKFMPGKKIKIFKYNKNLLNNVDYIFLGAWNFKKEIINKEKKFIKRGGKIISHIPFPQISSK